MKFDVEAFFDHCEALLKDNIAAKVAEINTEKGDSLLVAPTDKQFVTDFSESVINQDLFYYYSLDEGRPLQSVGEQTSVELTMRVYVAFIDPDGGEKTRKKAFRYTRALAEIYQKGFANESRVSDLEIFQHIPQSAQFEKQSNWYKIGGIEIKGTITT